MPFKLIHEAEVRWSDIDMAGVLNNAVYLTLLEEARFAYFRRLDLLEDDQFPFLLAETTVRFLRPGRAGMRLQVGARVERLGGRSLTMAYEVRHGEDLLATAAAVLVFVGGDLASRPLPQEARRRIAAFEGIPEGGAGRSGSGPEEPA